MIKNIVLDMGNVLLDFNPQVSLDAFCHSQAEKDIIRKELFNGPEWHAADLGEMKDGERYDFVKERVPREYWDALKLCCDKWDICMKPVEGAVAFCQYVKAQGYPIYILSNASDAFYRYFPNFLPFDFFDGIVVSADIRITKPDRGIYEYLFEQYRLRAEECLFIDDRADNIQGAIDAGMNACQFQDNFEQIKSHYHL